MKWKQERFTSIADQKKTKTYGDTWSEIVEKERNKYTHTHRKQMNNKTFITVNGVIGVGKSTVAKHLSQILNLTYYPESYELNPFIAEAFKGNQEVTTHCQTLAASYSLVNCLKASYFGGVVDVTPWYNYFIFTRYFLSTDVANLDAIALILSLVKSEPKAHLNIILRAKPETILERIKGRDRDYEQDLTLETIERICNLEIEIMRLDFDQGQNTLVIDTDSYSLSDIKDRVVRETLRSTPLVAS